MNDDLMQRMYTIDSSHTGTGLTSSGTYRIQYAQLDDSVVNSYPTYLTYTQSPWSTDTAWRSDSSTNYKVHYAPTTVEMECKICGHKVVVKSEDFRMNYVCDFCNSNTNPVLRVARKYLNSMNCSN